RTTPTIQPAQVLTKLRQNAPPVQAPPLAGERPSRKGTLERSVTMARLVVLCFLGLLAVGVLLGVQFALKRDREERDKKMEEQTRIKSKQDKIVEEERLEYQQKKDGLMKD